MTVRVVAADERWAAAFEREAAVLREALAPWLAGCMEHIGSTAVHGLAAKPVLDMLAGIADLQAATQAIPVLSQLGYQHAEHRPHEALWFFRQEGEAYDGRTHQLHLTEVGSQLWQERLAFRDALREDAQVRAAYDVLKRELADTEDDPAAYNADKRPFIAEVLRGRGIDLGLRT